MEYTTNYQLPLWDKEDAVLRTDFNENNQKIDAAIKVAAENGGCRFLTGSYTGTGVAEKKEISLGAKPKLVLLCGAFDGNGTYYYQSILVTDLFSYYFKDGGGSRAAVTDLVSLGANGFTVSAHETNINYGFNRIDKLYYYLAVC